MDYRFMFILFEVFYVLCNLGPGPIELRNVRSNMLTVFHCRTRMAVLATICGRWVVAVAIVEMMMARCPLAPAAVHCICTCVRVLLGASVLVCWCVGTDV